MRMTQYSRDISDKVDKPRRTGYPAYAAMTSGFTGDVQRVNYAFFAASASATAVRISATENGFVTTSCTMALRPCARSR